MVTCFVCALLSANAMAQDPAFTQFYANPLYLNPAFAGTAKCPRIVMNYRNQWPNLDGTFVTYSVSYDQHVDAVQGGLGLNVVNDQAGGGILSTTIISGMYSYLLNLTREFSLKAGAQVSYFQKHLDGSRLQFPDQFDIRFGAIFPSAEKLTNESISYFDYSAGVLIYSTKFYAGFAAHHLTQPNEPFIGTSSPLPMKLTAHAGALLPIGGKRSEMSISPNILYQQQAKFRQLNLGVYMSKGPIVVGAWYRLADSFIALLGIQYGLMKFGYSYDITTSSLGVKNTFGSHELSFGLQFECSPKKKRFRAVNCPTF